MQALKWCSRGKAAFDAIVGQPSNRVGGCGSSIFARNKMYHACQAGAVGEGRATPAGSSSPHSAWGAPHTNPCADSRGGSGLQGPGFPRAKDNIARSRSIFTILDSDTSWLLSGCLSGENECFTGPVAVTLYTCSAHAVMVGRMQVGACIHRPRAEETASVLRRWRFLFLQYFLCKAYPL
jgi:hypothetical protein